MAGGRGRGPWVDILNKSEVEMLFLFQHNDRLPGLIAIAFSCLYVMVSS